MVALDQACGALEQAERCNRWIIDPDAATAVSASPPRDPRLDQEEQGPFHVGFPVSVSPDGSAAAGCFTVRNAGSGLRGLSLIAVTALDDPEWTVIAEIDPDVVGGSCAAALAWTDDGIGVPLFGADRHVYLTPVE
jgi:hypothetical protein